MKGTFIKIFNSSTFEMRTLLILITFIIAPDYFKSEK